MSKLICLSSNTLSNYYNNNYISPLKLTGCRNQLPSRDDIERSFKNAATVNPVKIQRTPVCKDSEYSVQRYDNKRAYNKKMRNKKILLMFIIITLFAFISGLILTTNAFGSVPQTYSYAIVEKGDSLWSIASSFYGEEKDVRSVINDIIKLNSIKGDYIYPGMKLKLPVY